MDKLQMTVTLSADSAPDLLAYLQQYTGARERAFMLKLLAQRGLQLVLSAGPDALLRPPSAALTPTVAHVAPSPRTLERPDRAPVALMEAQPDRAVSLSAPVLDSPSAEPPPRAAPSPAPTSVPALSPAPTTGADPLAGLDLGALNEAMARFG